MLMQKLKQDQIKALKEKDQKRLEIIRYILSKLKNLQIEKRSELSDQEIIQVLRKIQKELKESLEFAEKNNRQDLKEEYKTQLEILQQYLPAELSDEQLKEKIKNIIQQNKDLFQQKPASLIGICVRQLKSSASPQRISRIVQEFIRNPQDL